MGAEETIDKGIEEAFKEESWEVVNGWDERNEPWDSDCQIETRFDRWDSCIACGVTVWII